MNKEPWYGKHAFWLLTAFCGGLTLYSDFRGRALFTVFFGALMFFSFLMALYYLSLQNVSDFLDNYEKAAEVQIRKKSIKVLKGGKV